jgi:hypothetical protein
MPPKTPPVPARAQPLDPELVRQLLDLALPADVDTMLGPQPGSTITVAEADKRVQKVIVAVHGMGDQVRNDTALSTAIRFCDFYKYRGAVSLGEFQPPPGHRPGLIIPAPPHANKLTDVMAFAEVHWADIARRIAKEGYTLQESKDWARSIVSRLRARAIVRSPANADIDYRRIRNVLEEIIDAIGIVETLLFITKKAGFGEVNLKALLDDYLGDVQLVTEFAAVRARIVSRFANTLAAVAAKYPNAELYVVAHSEGTVVSFLGLLEAADHPADHEWIKRVCGYMTFGSPIDKHLILWPHLFAQHKRPDSSLQLSIPWRNYVDYADPVGFDLDTARKWIKDRGYATIFDFKDADDFSFHRYAIPGKAHVDYWGDSDVFAHFIRDVVQSVGRPVHPPRRPPAPKSKLWKSIAVHVVGYLVPLLLIHVAVYILVSGVSEFFDPKDTAKHPNFIPTVLGLSWLVAGTTFWLRLVRLTRAWLWFGIGFVIYFVSAVGFFWMLALLDPRPSAVNELTWFERLTLSAHLPIGETSFAGSLLTIFVVLIVSLPRLRREPK